MIESFAEEEAMGFRPRGASASFCVKGVCVRQSSWNLCVLLHCFKGG